MVLSQFLDIVAVHLPARNNLPCPRNKYGLGASNLNAMAFDEPILI